MSRLVLYPSDEINDQLNSIQERNVELVEVLSLPADYNLDSSVLAELESAIELPFSLVFDNISYRQVDNDLYQVFYDCKSEEFEALTKICADVLFIRDVEARCELTIAYCNFEDIAYFQNLAAEKLGCPEVSVESLFAVDENDNIIAELSSLDTFVSEPIAVTEKVEFVPVKREKFSMKLNTYGTAGYYTCNKKCVIQPKAFERNLETGYKRKASPMTVKRGDLVLVDSIVGRRAFISFPIKGYLDLTQGLISPKWKAQIAEGEYLLKRDVTLSYGKSKSLLEKDTKVYVKHLKGNSAFVNLNNGRRGFVPFYKMVSGGVNFNFKFVPNKPVTVPVQEEEQNVRVCEIGDKGMQTYKDFNEVQQEWDSVSVASQFTAVTDRSTVSRNTQVSAESAMTNMTSASTVSRTSTFWGETGLYKAQKDVLVVTAPTEENEKVRRGQFVHVIAFERDQAIICEPFEGSVEFNRTNFKISNKTFTPGQYKTSFKAVDVLSANRDDAQIIDTLPPHSYVNLVRVSGASALIEGPVKGWISVAGGMLKKGSCPPTLFISGVPKSLKKNDLVKLLIEEGAFHPGIDSRAVFCRLILGKKRNNTRGKKQTVTNLAIVECISHRRAEKVLGNDLYHGKSGVVMNVRWADQYAALL